MPAKNQDTTTEKSIIHSTFVIERSYPAAPERVFAAFADPQQKRRWFVEGDHHDVEDFNMDFRVGGTEQSRFRFKEGTPVAGLACTNITVYLDIVKDERVVLASTMAIADKRISASLVTVEFLPSAGGGTDLVLTNQSAFFEGADGPEMREEGFRVLLGKLEQELAR
jgi:uncharacterized protein YndB with AHSA1/START domain